MEGKKEALIKEAENSSIDSSTLQHKLMELNSIKPLPYGTLHAVGIAPYFDVAKLIEDVFIKLFMKIFILITYLSEMSEE